MFFWLQFLLLRSASFLFSTSFVSILLCLLLSFIIAFSLHTAPLSFFFFRLVFHFPIILFFFLKYFSFIHFFFYLPFSVLRRAYQKDKCFKQSLNDVTCVTSAILSACARDQRWRRKQEKGTMSQRSGKSNNQAIFTDVKSMTHTIDDIHMNTCLETLFS